MFKKNNKKHAEGLHKSLPGGVCKRSITFIGLQAWVGF